MSSSKYSICIVSDFFFPRVGGVELHQYQVAQCLIDRGHRVIVVTGTYEDSCSNLKSDNAPQATALCHQAEQPIPTVRQGVRYLPNGLKVYYLPQLSIHSQASLPTMFTLFPLFRSIAIREGIQIVHGHQATSAMAHECLMHAKTMGLISCYTDHSLFSFSSPASFHLNKLMKFSMSEIDAAIAVSHTE